MMGANHEVKKMFMLGALSLIAGISPVKPTTEISVATLNVRNAILPNADLDPTELPWATRMEPLIRSILSEAPTVIGLQEVRGEEQLENVRRNLRPDYDCLVFNITNTPPIDHNVICYRKLQLGIFVNLIVGWVARTPDETYTKLEGMSSPRMWVTACFDILPRLPPSPDFCVLNTHLDWDSTESRLQAVSYFKQTARYMRDRKIPLLPAGVPLLAVGDFNMLMEEQAYLDMTDRRYIQTLPQSDNVISFIDLRRSFSNDNTSFTWEEYASDEPPQYPPMIIDYIFALDNGSIKPRDASSPALPDQMKPGGKWEVKSVDLINNTFQYGGKEYRYSDRRMLIARLSLPPAPESR